MDTCTVYTTYTIFIKFLPKPKLLLFLWNCMWHKISFERNNSMTDQIMKNNKMYRTNRKSDGNSYAFCIHPQVKFIIHESFLKKFRFFFLWTNGSWTRKVCNSVCLCSMATNTLPLFITDMYVALKTFVSMIFLRNECEYECSPMHKTNYYSQAFTIYQIAFAFTIEFVLDINSNTTNMNMKEGWKIK